VPWPANCSHNSSWCGGHGTGRRLIPLPQQTLSCWQCLPISRYPLATNVPAMLPEYVENCSSPTASTANTGDSAGQVQSTTYTDARQSTRLQGNNPRSARGGDLSAVAAGHSVRHVKDGMRGASDRSRHGGLAQSDHGLMLDGSFTVTRQRRRVTV
jgi:hypothetical protein